MNFKIKFWLFLIIFLAFLLRFYKLGKVPASLYWDEVSIGYNAYSILTSKRDEYGEIFPLRFKAFGEYKLPGYIYLTVPLVKAFGLNEFSVRLLSALVGVLTVFLIFFISKEIFKNQKKVFLIALVSTFLLAFSPWHLNLSRAAFEANLGLFFFCLGLFLLLKKSFIFAALSLSFSIYSYYSFWLLIPCLLAYFFFIEIEKKKILICSALVFLLTFPLIKSVILEKQQERFKQVSIFTNKDLLEESQLRRTRDKNSVLSKIFYHRYVVWTKEFFKNYTLHFSPAFLFFKGDGNSRHGPYQAGLLFPLTLPFLFFGTYLFLKEKNYLILFLLLISPLTAAFSWPAPHALRSALMAVILPIITALGLIRFYDLLEKNRFYYFKRIFYGLSALLFIFSFVLYLDNYYTHSYLNQAFDWGDGYSELTSFLKKEEADFEKIYISGGRWQPYIYALFYLKYSPLSYQKEGSDHGHFGKYYFGLTPWDEGGKRFYKTNWDWKTFLAEKNGLIILTPGEELNLPIFKTIWSVDGNEAFLIYKT